ncbi:MAG: translation initiation factor IF-3 [Planctomycetota bacterium]
MKNFHRINRTIRSRQVLLIDETGKNLGIVSLEEALKISESRGYDLVEVAPSAVPPVCKVMDYGKYKYQLQKREKEAKKAHKKIELKELRLHISISNHDLETKVRRAREFLSDGNKVKFTVFFRGREVALASKGEELLNRCIEYLKDISIIEKPINKEGNIMMVVLAPQKKGVKGGKSHAEVKNSQSSLETDKNNSQG